MSALLDVLLPYSRRHPNWESVKAEAMFKEFISKGFSYDAISSRPDYMVYASAELLAIILPVMIDEMLSRDNTENFLVYPMLTALDPDVRVVDPKSPDFEKRDDVYSERGIKVSELANSAFIERACRFLQKMTEDPPIPTQRLNRLLKFWHKKAGVSWLEPT